MVPAADGGRRKKTPEVIACIQALIEHETAGDPVSGLKWTRRTTAKLADELCALGIDVCPQTVARLLKAMGYSLRVNHKKLAGASHPRRDDPFRHITELRERCAADNVPVISVDTKKKELVGTFRNPGAKWDRSPEPVNDHDFRSDAEGLAIPYGIYDPRANAGTVFVGQTADTPAFAVDCIEKWWRTEGRKHYPGNSTCANACADTWNPIEPTAAGSNNHTLHGGRALEIPNLQRKNGPPLQPPRPARAATVAHYPNRPDVEVETPSNTACSARSPKNWAARLARQLRDQANRPEIPANHGGAPPPEWLRVRAHLVRKTWVRTGVKVPSTRKCGSYALTPDSSIAQMELHHRHDHVTKKRKSYFRAGRDALGLRDDSDIGQRRAPSSGVLLPGFLIRHRRQDDHVVALLPVDRRRHLLARRQLAGIE